MTGRIFNIAETALNGLDIHYETREMMFVFTVTDDLADFRVGLIADDDIDRIMVCVCIPSKVPQANRDRMCTLINELNYETAVGAFSINPENGELAFRLANNVSSETIDAELVQTCLFQAIYRVRDCYEKIMREMYGGPQMNFTFVPSKDSKRS